MSKDKPRSPSLPNERRPAPPSATQPGWKHPVDIPPPAKIAIVLSGGASHGDFEAGALQYLCQVKGVAPSILCGTSVGSVNTFGLATQGGIDAVVADWKDLKSASDMFVPQPWLAELKQWLKAVDAFAAATGAEYSSPVALTGLAGGAALAAAPIAGLAGGAGLAFPSMSALAGVALALGPISLLPVSFVSMAWPVLLQAGVDTVQTATSLLTTFEHILSSALRSKSLYTLDPVRQRLAAADDGQASVNVANSQLVIRLATVQLESGAVRLVTESGQFLDDPSEPPVDLLDAVLASSSIPGIFEAIRLNSYWYVDGGVALAIPIQAALDAGADHVYAVEDDVPDMDTVDSFHDAGMVGIVMRSVMGVMPHAIMTDDVQPPSGWGPKVTVIQPTVEVHDSLTIDPGLVDISMDYGYMRAYEAATLAAQQPPMTKTAPVKGGGGGGVKLPMGLMAARSSDAITSLRKGIWVMEHHANAQPYLNFASDPAAVSSTAGRVDLVVRATDDKLWHGTLDEPSNRIMWEDLGGRLTSAPAIASWGGGRLDVFARGVDNCLWTRSFDEGTGVWSDWSNALGGSLASAPAAVSWGPGRIDVFVRWIDDSIWTIAMDQRAWGQWEQLGGHDLAYAPAVASGAKEHLDLFAVGSDALLYQRTFDSGAWGAWQLLPDQELSVTAQPAAVAPKQGVLELFVRAASGSVIQTSQAIYHRTFKDGRWHDAGDLIQPWGDDWEHLGGRPISAPAAVAPTADTLDTYIVQSAPADILDQLLGSSPNLLYRKRFDKGWAPVWDCPAPGGLRPDPSQSWLRVRDMKNELAQLLRGRTKSGFDYPPNMSVDAVDNWERHAWTPLAQDPWGAYSNQQLDIHVPPGAKTF